MEPKFILTLNGYLRIGNVQMHKDLLLAGDTCIGGGFWEVDTISMRLQLSGKSYDYGKPKWNFLACEGRQACPDGRVVKGEGLEGDLVTGNLYVPKEFEGLGIEYRGDSFVDYVNVSQWFEISYY